MTSLGFESLEVEGCGTSFHAPPHHITLTSLCTDEVINHFFKLLRKESEEFRGLPKICVYDSFFFKTIQMRGLQGVARWAKKEDPFQAEVVLFPLHVSEVSSGHWALIAAFPRQKLIRSLDSLGREYPEHMRQVLLYFESKESNSGKNFDRASWTLKGNPTNLPRQTNSVDCGFLVCFFAERLARGTDPTTANPPSSVDLRRYVVTSLRTGRVRKAHDLERCPPPQYFDGEPGSFTFEELEVSLQEGMFDTYVRGGRPLEEDVQPDASLAIREEIDVEEVTPKLEDVVEERRDTPALQEGHRSRKRRTKWVRLPDGTRKRINVRRLDRHP